MTQLLEQGGSTLPDVIAACFTALSTVFKHLSRQLAADLPAALRCTAGLRYSAAAGKHVRAFAAQVGLFYSGCGKGFRGVGSEV